MPPILNYVFYIYIYTDRQTDRFFLTNLNSGSMHMLFVFCFFLNISDPLLTICSFTRTLFITAAKEVVTLRSIISYVIRCLQLNFNYYYYYFRLFFHACKGFLEHDMHSTAPESTTQKLQTSLREETLNKFHVKNFY